jgi:hypothetical protein
VPQPAAKTPLNKDQAAALERMSAAIRGKDPIQRTAAAHPYSSALPNTSVRDGFGRCDYDHFRPEERRRGPLGAIQDCQDAYLDVPVIHNVVNLMSDFVVQGMDLVHPNPEVRTFFKGWARGVKLRERSERLANLVIRQGTAVVVREEERLRKKEERDLRRSVAKPDPPRVEGRSVPWRYTILSPLNIEALAPELDTFANGSPGLFAIRVPDSVANLIKRPRTDAERQIVATLPEEVLQAATRRDRLAPIDPAKVSVLHYKKDDGQAWGTSPLHPLRGAVQLYRKMVLADMAALDGAMSQIRVWKLGNLELKIFPTDADVNKLAELLMSNTAGGVTDIIWRPDIELVESKNEGWRFLGSEKFAQVMADIYSGLGVPPTLTGTTGSSGTTNNLVSIKTLIERLEYVRMLLEQFWSEEIRRVQRAMNFRFPATLVYDRMALSDEAAELALLIQLADRDYISTEYLLERFGALPEIEQVRLRQEARRRKRSLMPQKASPWHDPEKEHKKEMAFIGARMVTPSQVGLDVGKPKDGEVYTEPAPAPTPAAGGGGVKKGRGQPQQGRPRNSKDSKKRKQKRFVPAGAALAGAVAAAEEAQGRIAEWCHPLYLASLAKSNLRQLTDQEALDLEEFKFDLLYALAGAEPTEGALVAAAQKVEQGGGAPPEARAEFAAAAAGLKRPTMERLRGARSAVYAASVLSADAGAAEDAEVGADVAA